jgi:hypothetical protein
MTIELPPSGNRGRQFPAGHERAAAWTRIVAEAPQFAGYLEKTDREIPVVRLTRER